MKSLHEDLAYQVCSTFFINERLRFYLRDLMGNNQHTTDRKGSYSPIFLYLLHLHKFKKVTKEASDYWLKHRSKFQQAWMLDGLSAATGVDKEQIPGMIDVAFRKWDESDEGDRLLRLVKFDGSMTLADFFDTLLNKGNYTLLKEPSAAIIRAVPDLIETVPENDAALPVDQLDNLQGDVVDSGKVTIEDESSVNNAQNDDFGYERGHEMDYVTNLAMETDEFNYDDSGNDFGNVMNNEGKVAIQTDGISNDGFGFERGHGTDNVGIMDMEVVYYDDLGNEIGNVMNNEGSVAMQTNGTYDDYCMFNGYEMECEGNEDNLCLTDKNDDESGLNNGQLEMNMIGNTAQCSMLVVEHDNSYMLELRNYETRMIAPKQKKEPLCICEICGTGYSVNESQAKINLENHYLSKHNLIRCVECNEQFASLTEKVTHTNGTHSAQRNKSVFICDLCNLEIIANTKWKFELRTHMDLKHKQHHQCLQCAKSFKNKIALNSHVYNHHILYECKHDGFVSHGYGRFFQHSLRHKCRENNCRKFFESVEECILHEEISHFKSVCEICNVFCPGNIEIYFKHLRKCSREKEESRLSDVRIDLVDSFRKITVPQRVMDLAQLAGNNNQGALFTQSILYAMDDAGNIIHDTDRYPFWDKKLICPAFGSHSFKSENNNTNSIRNQNPMVPWWFKPFTFNSYPLGSSCMFMYDSELNMPKWSFQLFILKDWMEYQQDKGVRTSFKANKDLSKGIQRAPKVLNKEMDRGHLVAFQYACSRLDQQELQNQGNIFYQMAAQNRGIWKKMESDLIKELQQRKIPRSHITTGVNYVKENGEVIYSHGIPVVHSYYKVCFMEDSSGKVNDVVCYALRNDNSTRPKEVPRVSLFDIETIVPTHQFLNADLERRMHAELLKKHSSSWTKAVP